MHLICSGRGLIVLIDQNSQIDGIGTSNMKTCFVCRSYFVHQRESSVGKKVMQFVLSPLDGVGAEKRDCMSFVRGTTCFFDWSNRKTFITFHINVESLAIRKDMNHNLKNPVQQQHFTECTSIPVTVDGLHRAV